MSEAMSEPLPQGFASVEDLVTWLPEQAAVAAQAIRTLYGEGEFDRAEKLAATAIRLFPDRPELWLQRAMVPMHRPDKEEAVRRYKAMRLLFPEFAPAY